VKPSATSTFNQTDFSKMLATTYSAKLVSKTRSFRAKLKSKILKPRTKSIATAKPQAFWTSSFTYHKANSISEKNTVVTAICKLMNKSLGLFRSNSKKSKIDKEYYTNSTKFVSFINNNNETQCSISIDNNPDEYSYNINANTCCVSTPKKARLPRTRVFHDDNLEDEISAMNFQSPTVHSTPNYFLNNFQLNNNSNLENSYLSASTATASSSSVSLISGNRLKSFGMTSSPMSTNSLKNSIGTESSRSYSESYFPRYDDAEPEVMNQERLIRHLNNIKRNVRLSVELRSAGTLVSEVASKKRLYELKGETVTNSTKKRRLQKMFRLKIQRQLKEIKMWRIGFKNKLDVSHVNGMHYESGYDYYPEYHYDGCHYYN